MANRLAAIESDIEFEHEASLHVLDSLLLQHFKLSQQQKQIQSNSKNQKQLTTVGKVLYQEIPLTSPATSSSLSVVNSTFSGENATGLNGHQTWSNQEHLNYSDSNFHGQNNGNSRDVIVNGHGIESVMKSKEFNIFSNNNRDADSRLNSNGPAPLDRERGRETDDNKSFSDGRQGKGYLQVQGQRQGLREGQDSSARAFSSSGGGNQGSMYAQSGRPPSAYIRPTRSSFLKTVFQSPLLLSRDRGRGRDGEFSGYSTPSSEKPNPFRGKPTNHLDEKTPSSYRKVFSMQRDRPGPR